MKDEDEEGDNESGTMIVNKEVMEGTMVVNDDGIMVVNDDSGTMVVNDQETLRSGMGTMVINDDDEEEEGTMKSKCENSYVSITQTSLCWLGFDCWKSCGTSLVELWELFNIFVPTIFYIDCSISR